MWVQSPRSAIFCWLHGAKEPKPSQNEAVPWLLGNCLIHQTTILQNLHGEKSSTYWSLVGSEDTENKRVLFQHVIISPSQLICLYDWRWEKLFEKNIYLKLPWAFFNSCRYWNSGNFCWVGILHIKLWYAIFHCFATLCS